VLREWGEFRVATVRRRTQFRLDRCEERLHIVEGRLKAYAKIDEIIKLIRSSEDQAEAKQKLKERFKFTERQAEDIVNLRLGQLTRLDGAKLNEERKALEVERKGLKLLLGDEKELKKLVISELQEDAKKYGDDRRTLIKTAERAQLDGPWLRVQARRPRHQDAAGEGLHESGRGRASTPAGEILGGKIRGRAFLRFAAARIPARRDPGAAERWSRGSAFVFTDRYFF